MTAEANQLVNKTLFYEVMTDYNVTVTTSYSYIYFILYNVSQEYCNYGQT